MATAYYFAAHGAHFPMVHTAQKQSPTSPSPDSTVSVHQQTPHIPATAAKTERADSIIPAVSPPPNMMNEQTKSTFFRLPAELRNQIYDELLCASTPRRFSDLSTAIRIPTPAPCYPAILSTCRKIHAEATDLLYTTHIFHAHPSLLTSLPHLMATSKPVLYPSVISKIHRWQLTIRLDTDPRFTAAQATAAFSGAEFLDIKVWQSMFDGCNAGVLKLFMGIRGVRCARVEGSVDDELARWLEERMMSPVEEGGERCGGCDKGVQSRLEGNGAGVWGDEGDAWRFGNR